MQAILKQGNQADSISGGWKGGGGEPKEASAHQHVCALAVLQEMHPWEARGVPEKQHISLGQQWEAGDVPGTAKDTSLGQHGKLTSSIWSSVRKSQYPSIMSTALSVPAMIKSSLLSSICCTVGFTTNPSSGSKPTRTPATAFFNGISAANK